MAVGSWGVVEAILEEAVEGEEAQAMVDTVEAAVLGLVAEKAAAVEVVVAAGAMVAAVVVAEVVGHHGGQTTSSHWVKSCAVSDEPQLQLRRQLRPASVSRKQRSPMLSIPTADLQRRWSCCDGVLGVGDTCHQCQHFLELQRTFCWLLRMTIGLQSRCLPLNEGTACYPVPAQRCRSLKLGTVASSARRCLRINNTSKLFSTTRARPSFTHTDR